MLWHKAVFERRKGSDKWTQVEYKIPPTLAKYGLLQYDGKVPLGDRISSEYGPDEHEELEVELHWQSNSPAIIRVLYDNTRSRSVSRTFKELARITVDGQRLKEEDDGQGRKQLVLKIGLKDLIDYQLVASVRLGDKNDKNNHKDRIRLYRADGEPMAQHSSLVDRFAGSRWKLGEEGRFMLYYAPCKVGVWTYQHSGIVKMSQVVPAQPWKAITVELEGYLQASKNETGVQVISVVGAPGIVAAHIFGLVSQGRAPGPAAYVLPTQVEAFRISSYLSQDPGLQGKEDTYTVYSFEQVKAGITSDTTQVTLLIDVSWYADAGEELFYSKLARTARMWKDKSATESVHVALVFFMNVFESERTTNLFRRAVGASSVHVCKYPVILPDIDIKKLNDGWEDTSVVLDAKELWAQSYELPGQDALEKDMAALDERRVLVIDGDLKYSTSISSLRLVVSAGVVTNVTLLDHNMMQLVRRSERPLEYYWGWIEMVVRLQLVGCLVKLGDVKYKPTELGDRVMRNYNTYGTDFNTSFLLAYVAMSPEVDPIVMKLAIRIAALVKVGLNLLFMKDGSLSNDIIGFLSPPLTRFKAHHGAIWFALSLYLKGNAEGFYDLSGNMNGRRLPKNLELGPILLNREQTKAIDRALMWSWLHRMVWFEPRPKLDDDEAFEVVTDVVSLKECRVDLSNEVLDVDRLREQSREERNGPGIAAIYMCLADGGDGGLLSAEWLTLIPGEFFQEFNEVTKLKWPMAVAKKNW
ncbi:hypothetical protein UCREL1_4710 [Eutypa lata UCREL1]|uniref:Uncharacterized protein n=1 Tax=Eutypa lata (strain UCR-EL1) TaxID=1287681 RepID=M7TNI6_EUTLA|nr:hypothetical protein UCREL1_4710 [Eutypa lata UCREL1]